MKQIISLYLSLFIIFFVFGQKKTITVRTCDRPTQTQDVWIANPDTSVISLQSDLNLIQSLRLTPLVCDLHGVQVIQFAKTDKGIKPSSYDYLNNRHLNPQKIN
jgi:hypothetical protein